MAASLPFTADLPLALGNCFREVLFDHRTGDAHALRNLIERTAIASLKQEGKTSLGGQARKSTLERF